jgi:hypothetical protein
LLPRRPLRGGVHFGRRAEGDAARDEPRAQIAARPAAQLFVESKRSSASGCAVQSRSGGRGRDGDLLAVLARLQRRGGLDDARHHHRRQALRERRPVHLDELPRHLARRAIAEQAHQQEADVLGRDLRRERQLGRTTCDVDLAEVAEGELEAPALLRRARLADCLTEACEARVVAVAGHDRDQRIDQVPMPARFFR